MISARAGQPRTGDSGRFVVIVGPDGVGKTTLARNLLARYDGPTAYFHFRPPVRGPVRSMPRTHPRPAPSKGKKRGSVVLGWLRLGRNFVWFWLAYLATVLPTVRRGALVVGDRWAYGYVAQPYALKYYGPEWLARLAVRALPEPDVVLSLVADPVVIHARKQELEIGEIETEIELWGELSASHVVVLDASPAPETIAETAARIIGI